VTPEDLDNVHELLSSWEVVRHMCLPLCSKQESEKFIRDAVDQADTAPWQSIVRAVIDASSVLAGLCGIVILRGSEEGEIWYLVKPECWGQGVGTAAAADLLELGFAQLGLHRLWANCLPENPASAKVLEKVGMRREGLRKSNLKIHGTWKDSFLYAILADEWQAGRKAVRGADTRVCSAICGTGVETNLDPAA
jgi:RimJ/RimL family protein N-acetyltransferase